MSSVAVRGGSDVRVRDKHWKSEQFWGPGAPKNLNDLQHWWFDLYHRSTSYREGKAELATVIVALSMRSLTEPNGERPMEVCQLNPDQQFMLWSELQINLLYHVNRRRLVDRLKRERLHFTGVFARPDASGLMSVDASDPSYFHDLYKAPIREHHLFETVQLAGKLQAQQGGLFRAEKDDLHCDLFIDDAVAYRIPLEAEHLVDFITEPGKNVKPGQALVQLKEQAVFGAARVDAEGYWEMDYGGGDLVRAFDPHVLQLANSMWEMQLDSADGRCLPLSPSLVLPRSYHAVPDGVRARINHRSPTLVEEFCHAIGPGAGPAPYQVVSPFEGEVTAIDEMESYPINPANADEGTMKFYSLRIGDQQLPGRLPGSAMLYVKLGDRVRKGQLLADPLRRDYYESIVDVEAVVPGNLANWLIRDFAERYKVRHGNDSLWPTHLLMQETITQSQPIADMRPALPHLRSDGTILLAIPRADIDTLGFGSWSLVPPTSLTDPKHPANRK